MSAKVYLARSAVAAALLFIFFGSGCASPPVEQTAPTSHMRSTVGTPDELSPLTPVGATNIRKAGNRWTCDLYGQTLIYNDAASRWDPQPK